MFGKHIQPNAHERRDQLGQGIVRLSASNEAEAEEVASSPFLYARVRSRVADERTRREAGEGWLAFVGVFWRAAPAMALMAVIAFALFWSARAVAPSFSGLSDEALLAAHNEAGVEYVVFSDRKPLSNDEVLTSILDADEPETSR